MAATFANVRERGCQDKHTDATGDKSARDASLKYKANEPDLPRRNLHKVVNGRIEVCW